MAAKSLDAVYPAEVDSSHSKTGFGKLRLWQLAVDCAALGSFRAARFASSANFVFCYCAEIIFWVSRTSAAGGISGVGCGTGISEAVSVSAVDSSVALPS